MRRIVSSLLLTASMIFVPKLFAEATQADPVMSAILKTGKLRIALDPTSYPLAIKRANGAFEGFEIDLGHYLGKSIDPKIKVVFVSVKWDRIIESVKKGEADIGMNGLFIPPKEEIEDWSVYSTPYYRTGIAIAYSSKKKNVTLQSIQKEKAVVATFNDPQAIKVLKQHGLEMKLFDNNEEHLHRLASGKSEYAAYDYPILMDFVNKSKGKLVMMPGVLLDSESDYGIVIQKKATDLVKAVNMGIADWKADPIEKKKMEKWTY